MKIKILLLSVLIILLGSIAWGADVTTWHFGLNPSSPLVTGQITQYDGQEDDGDREDGIARSYTALTTGPYAGTTNITVNAKTIAMENGAVIDNQTGLMWMAYTPDSDIGPRNDGKLYWYKAADTENIFAFCTAANAASLAGHSDWRVPNIFELFSLVVEDAGIGAPYINTTYFQCLSDSYWASSTRPSDTTRAFAVRFTYPDAYMNYTKNTNSWYVRLVRTTP